MTNTAVTLHLVRTDATATNAHDASTSWDVTVADTTAALAHLSGYSADECWVTASATGAAGEWLGSGRAGFGRVDSDWA